MRGIFISLLFITFSLESMNQEEFSCSFNHPQSPGYQLNVHTSHGTLTFEFQPIDVCNAEDGAFYDYVQSCLKSTASVDVWPLNGRTNQPLSELFSLKACKELSYQIQTLTDDSIQTRLFVLDLKDHQGRYQALEQIRHGEDTVSKFLIIAQPRRTIHNFLRPHKIAFFLREGLLKATLINTIVSQQLRVFFDNAGSENKERRGWFCILCELIMNGFKTGYQVKITTDLGTHYLHPRSFFAYACPPVDILIKPTIFLKELYKKPLITLYIPFYKDIYSTASLYYKTLSATSFFKIYHTLTKKDITCITIVGESHE